MRYYDDEFRLYGRSLSIINKLIPFSFLTRHRISIYFCRFFGSVVSPNQSGKVMNTKKKIQIDALCSARSGVGGGGGGGGDCRICFNVRN